MPNRHSQNTELSQKTVSKFSLARHGYLRPLFSFALMEQKWRKKIAHNDNGTKPACGRGFCSAFILVKNYAIHFLPAL